LSSLIAIRDSVLSSICSTGSLSRSLRKPNLRARPRPSKGTLQRSGQVHYFSEAFLARSID